MKAKQEATTKPSEPDKVDEYMLGLDHPMKPVMEALRKLILSVDTEIGEEVKWNAPAFFYAGLMQPFNPKEYKRYLIVFNIFKKDCVCLVFPSGAKINDTTGLLEGDYADGRRLAMFYSLEDVTKHEKTLRQAIKKWLAVLEKG